MIGSPGGDRRAVAGAAVQRPGRERRSGPLRRGVEPRGRTCGCRPGRVTRPPSGASPSASPAWRASRAPCDPPPSASGRAGPGAAASGPGAASRSATSRRSCPARSSPTRTSPSRRSADAGSPRALRLSTATSTTVFRTSAAENGRRSNRSGAPNRPDPGTISGSPDPPETGSSATFARVRGPGGRTAPGGSSSTLPDASSSPSPSRAASRRNPALDPAHRRRDERLGTAVDELDHPAVAGDRRLDRGERAGQGRPPASPTAPGSAGRTARRGAGRRPPRSRSSRRSPSRSATGAPGSAGPAAGRGRAGSGGAAPPPPPAPSQPRPSDASSPIARVVDGPLTPTTAVALPSSRRPEVGPEAGLDRAAGSALEPLDEAADRPDPVLEREPRMALAPLARATAGGPGRPGSGASRCGPG